VLTRNWLGVFQVPESANELQAVLDDLAVAAGNAEGYLPSFELGGGARCGPCSDSVPASAGRGWYDRCGRAGAAMLTAVARDDLLAGELVRVGVAGDRASLWLAGQRVAGNANLT
jgi:hypothetical protein